MKRPLSGTYEFEDFRIDGDHSMLYRDGDEVRLPPKAVETLFVLVAASGRILTKDELMDAVWAGSAVEESNLSQYLHLLRKTLGFSRDGKPFIETLRRRGYRFTAATRRGDSPDPFDSDTVPPGGNAEPPFGTGMVSPVRRMTAGGVLVGRDDELAELVRLLDDPDVRLLTMTGVGGVGKTTLAHALIDCVRNNFRDGVLFAELAPVTTAGGVASAMASLLGVQETADKSAVDSVKDNLRKRSGLLVLDNFEQVAVAAPFVVELLRECEELKIVVTSRVLLHVRAEREFAVPPLGFASRRTDESERTGGGQADAAAAESTAGDAVRLFAARARAVKPAFRLTAENADVVAEICRRLDGLPLAIELAASRIKLMSPPAILDRLRNQLALLTGGATDLPPRQRTMRQTVSWSVDLLEEDENALFRGLSVFAGGFSIEAAEGVCGFLLREGPVAEERTNSRSSVTTVLDKIASLVDKSLLTPKENRNSDVRFRMLEVVREFASESLSERGESEELKRRHAEYFDGLGQRVEPLLQTAGSGEWLERLEEDHDNLRAALDWAAANDNALGARLAGNLWRFWWLHGHIREGCERLAKFLEPAESFDAAARIKLLIGLSVLNRLRANFALSQSSAEEGLDLSVQSGDGKSGAHFSYQLGLIALDAEGFARAEKLFNQGLRFAEKSDDRQMQGLLFNGLGEAARLRGDFGRASDFYGQALALNREVGDTARQTTNLINLGATALALKDHEAASGFYCEGLEASSKMADMNGTLYCLEGMAGAFWASRNAGRAAMLFGAANEFRQINSLLIEPADRVTYDRSVAAVRDSLTADRFRECFAEGQKLNLEAAVALALSSAPPG